MQQRNQAANSVAVGRTWRTYERDDGSIWGKVSPVVLNSKADGVLLTSTPLDPRITEELMWKWARKIGLTVTGVEIKQHGGNVVAEVNVLQVDVARATAPRFEMRMRGLAIPFRLSQAKFAAPPHHEDPQHGPNTSPVSSMNIDEARNSLLMDFSGADSSWARRRNPHRDRTTDVDPGKTRGTCPEATLRRDSDPARSGLVRSGRCRRFC